MSGPSRDTHGDEALNAAATPGQDETPPSPASSGPAGGPDDVPADAAPAPMDDAPATPDEHEEDAGESASDVPAPESEPSPGAASGPESGAESDPADDPSATGDYVAESDASVPAVGGDGGGDDGGDDDADDDEEDWDDDEEEEDEDDDDAGTEMSLLDHMEELRHRLTRAIIGALVGFLACYAFAQQMFDLLVLPLVKVLPEGSSLIFTALPEAFFTYIKISFVAGIFVASPYIFYQIWAFIAPGLYKEERKWMLPIAACSAVFFVSGALFGYFVVFPFAFGFFMEYSTDLIKAMPSLSEYLGFSLKLLFAFGLTFELPLFVFFLARLGIVNAAMLRRVRKFAILGAFIMSAILTPPDVVSQVLMAGPLLILYEASIFVAQFFGKTKPAEETEEDEGEEDEEEGTDEDANGDGAGTETTGPEEAAATEAGAETDAAPDADKRGE
ncbi:MAG: twin-arginine translocase subunit TatC [Desulfovibrionaceae bacterium]|jgi:sec-independent protein translocase protein TatC|nr:twin-arginine translocase subunit TatC [Desulfovibrionaceae bacterium]